MSTSGDVQYIGGICGWYIRGCSVHRRDTISTSGDIMIYVGEQTDKSLRFILKTPMYS